jgi:hypothetical protein
MAKEKRSARELADMIATRMIIKPGLVSVYKDTTRGWAANVFTGPSHLYGDQHLAEQIASDVREKYDLME